MPDESIFARRLNRISLACAIAAGAIAVLALVGRIFDIPRLIQLRPDLATMKVNTATSLVLCSIAMVLRLRAVNSNTWRRIAGGLSLLALLIGSLTLLQYATGLDFRIDQLLYRDMVKPRHGYLGRMSVATATSLTFIAAGIFLRARSLRTSQAMAVGGLLVAVLGLLGYFYGGQTLYHTFPFSSMALHTAVALALLGFSNLSACNLDGMQPLLGRNSVGGSLVRRLLPATILVPLFLGWLLLLGQKEGYYDVEFSRALFALFNIVVLTVIVWWNASMLDESNAHRERIQSDRDDLLIREQHARVRAEKALLARDQLLAIVSHELRTPLTPALLTTTALHRRTDLPADMLEDLQLIREQIEVEVRLIDDLLDMASLNQGKLMLKRQVVDITVIAKSVVAALGPQLEEQRVDLAVELQSQSPRLMGDPLRLRQILINLLGNAIKFTPPKGRVTLRTFDAPGDHLGIEISDSGVGIEPDALARIFNAFEQGDPSTTRQFGGLGVGLTISKNLVQLHGGTLTAASEGTGHGATFTVRLPRSLTPADATASPGQTPSAAKTLAILVVDDNSQTLTAMERILRSRGHNVFAATSAEAALNIAAAQSLDLLISDISLPDLSGWELMRQLREEAPIRGIAVSGFVEESDQAKSLEAGFSVHLRKPLDIPALITAIAAVTADPSPPAAPARPPASS